MDLPPPEALLDIDWLEREHVVRGTKGLEMCLRRGAERYGGAVTALADAALSFDMHGCWRLGDATDFRHFLAHRLLAGSWSPAAEGPRRYRREAGMSYMMATASRERREAFWAKACSAGLLAGPATHLAPTLRASTSTFGGVCLGRARRRDLGVRRVAGRPLRAVWLA